MGIYYQTSHLLELSSYEFGNDRLRAGRQLPAEQETAFNRSKMTSCRRGKITRHFLQFTDTTVASLPSFHFETLGKQFDPGALIYTSW